MSDGMPAPESGGSGQTADFRSAVNALAGLLAAELSPSRIKEAVVAALTPGAAAGGRQPVSADDLAGQLVEIFRRHVEGEEFASRVRAEAAGAAGQAPAAAQSSEADLAARAREAAAQLLQEQLPRAVAEAMAALPDEARTRELAAESAAGAAAQAAGAAAGRFLQSDELKQLVRSEAERAAAESSLQDDIGSLRLELQARPGAKELAALADEVRQGIAAAGERTAELRASVSKLAARVLESDGRAAAAAAKVFDEKIGGEAFRKTVVEAARAAITDLVDTAVLEAMDAVPGEPRVKELAGEAAAAGFAAGLAGDAFSGRVRELAAASAGEVLEARLYAALGDFVTGEMFVESVRRLIAEAAAPLVSERIGAALAEHLVSGALERRVREIAARAAEEVLPGRLESALAAHTAGEELARRVRELSAEVGIRVADARVTAALMKHLESDDLAQRIRGLAGTAAAEALGPRLSALEEGLGRRVETSRLQEELDAIRASMTGYAAREDVEQLSGAADRARTELSSAVAELRSDLDQEARAGLDSVRENCGELSGRLTKLEESGADERLRNLIREETGGLNRDALRERMDERLRTVVLEMIRGGELQEQLKVTVKKALSGAQPVRRESTRRVVKGGGMDIPGAEELPEDAGAAAAGGDADAVLQRLVDSDEFKLALDERFRTMLEYLKSEVIPAEIARAGSAAD